VGIELGYLWERQTIALSLTGNLAQYEARVVLVQAVIGQFEPVQLVFAWTQATNNVPLILSYRLWQSFEGDLSAFSIKLFEDYQCRSSFHIS